MDLSNFFQNSGRSYKPIEDKKLIQVADKAQNSAPCSAGGLMRERARRNLQGDLPSFRRFLRKLG